MSSFSKPIEPDRLFECLPTSLRPTKSDNGNDGLETDSYRTPTLIPPRVLALMNDIAQQLVQSGNQQSCYQIYRDCRASALELSLRKLGLEQLRKVDVQKMQWEALEAKIGNWIHFMRIAVKLLLPGERQICNKIFYGVNINKGHCFAELTTNSIVSLINFGDAVAMGKRSPEMLFLMLDMYEVMCKLQPEIEIIFEGKPCSEIRDAALGFTKRMAQTIHTKFTDFEIAVENDGSKTFCHDGTVHPLTSYVINYVKFLLDYQSTLELLFEEFETSDAEFKFPAVITRIMQSLQNNLDGKSKQYKDPALTYLFLMNNIYFMVTKVRRSEVKHILGDDWIERHHRIVQQNVDQYKNVAWAKILQTLSVQFAGSSGISSATIKERLKSFNMQFEELHAKQSQWSIPDQELRQSLRIAVAEVLLPAYQSFVQLFSILIENSKNQQKYIRYSPEAVDQLLGQFFEGQQSVEEKEAIPGKKADSPYVTSAVKETQRWGEGIPSPIG
ncbi:hypothetical protein QOZ80_9AG0676350 [Eleusine coracana subsp. coracana]|nr:hypothetical protein QOZ80_9AG0676350 [Eleusine coracana subsp. coracana]